MTDDIQNGWGAQALDTEQNARKYHSSVLSGCAPSDGSGALEIDVASGEVVVDGTKRSVTATTKTLTSGGSEPRKDIVYVDSAGAVQVVQGTPSPAAPSGQTRRDTYVPAPPDLSSTAATVIAEVWIAANASDFGSADISDRRLLADATVNTLDTYGRLTVHGSDIRMDNGQAVEDESGTARLSIVNGDRTILRDGAGSGGVDLHDANYLRLRAESDRPIQIEDTESSSIAVQYDTDATAGVLRTPNAGMRVEADNFPSSGAGMELRYDSSTPQAQIIAYDRTNNQYDPLQISGNPLQLSSPTAGYVEIAGADDLRLATGQAIEDGSGTRRYNLFSNRTDTYDDSGSTCISFKSGDYNRIYARSGQPFQIYDDNGAFTAVEYTTVATAPGTLELTNAELVLPSNTTNINFQDKFGAINWPDQGGGQTAQLFEDSNGEIIGRDDNGNTSTLT